MFAAVNKDPAAFFASPEALPTVVDMVAWSLRQTGDEWPLFYNDDTHRWQWMRAQLSSCSEAQIDFAQQFLLAYAKLHPSLRAGRGTLAVGAAACVAYQSRAATSMAVLPVEVQNQAGIFALLMLVQPKLLEACFTEAGDPVTLARETLTALCQGTTNPGHRDVAWLTEPGTTVTLESVIPPNTEVANSLFPKFAAAPLVLRAMLTATSAPTRLGLPFYNGDSKDPYQCLASWTKELNDLLSEAKLMLQRRHDKCKQDTPDMRVGTTLAPSFLGPDSKVCIVDHALGGPLLFMAARIDADMLRNQWRDLQKGDRDRQAVFQAALHQAPTLRKVFDVIGSLPAFEVLPGKGDAVTGHLSFGKVARISPKHPGEPVGLDELIFPLTNFENAGQAKPIRGIGNDMFIFARPTPSDTPAWHKVSTVQVGWQVSGCRDADPLSALPIDFPSKPPHAEWFEVVATQVHAEVHQVAGVFFRGFKEPIIVALQHALCGEFPRKSWSEARSLDPQARLFDGKALQEIERVVPQSGNYTTTEFELIHDQRRVASNLLVSHDASGTHKVIAEARPAEGSAVKPGSMVLVNDGTTSIRVEDIIPNPELKPGTNATVIVGAASKRDQDHWVNCPTVITKASVGEYPTAHALKVTRPNAPGGYFELGFDDGTTLAVAWPGGWLLENIGHANSKDVSIFHIYHHRLQQDGSCKVAVLATDGSVKHLTSVKKHDGMQTKWVLVEQANQQWAAISGVLVATESRPMHEHRTGFQPLTRMSLPGDKTVPVKDPSLLDAPLKLFDEALNAFSERPLTKQRQNYTSRMLKVSAGGQTLVVAPLQYLPVLMNDKLVIAPAGGIPDGALLLMEQPGSKVPEPKAIDFIRPVFRALDQTVVAEAEASGGIANVASRDANIGFAEKIAVYLTLAGTDGIAEALRTEQRGEEGIGNASGDTETKQPIKGGATAVKSLSPVTTDLAQHNELITMDSALVAQFVDRGLEINAALKREEARLHEPSGENADWFCKLLVDAGQTDLRKARSHGYTLNMHLTQHIKQRQLFLQDEKIEGPGKTRIGGRTPAVLTSVLHAQMILAGLANACGAADTARRLVRDSIELSIIAGCDLNAQGKPSGRLQADLNLAAALRLPEIVFGDKQELIQLNPIVLTQLKAWADANEMSDKMVVDESLRRKGLWAFWQSLAGGSPFMSALPMPPTSGSSGFPAVLRQWLEQRAAIARQRLGQFETELKQAEQQNQRLDQQEKRYRAIEE